MNSQSHVYRGIFLYTQHFQLTTINPFHLFQNCFRFVPWILLIGIVPFVGIEKYYLFQICEILENLSMSRYYHANISFFDIPPVFIFLIRSTIGCQQCNMLIFQKRFISHIKQSPQIREDYQGLTSSRKQKASSIKRFFHLLFALSSFIFTLPFQKGLHFIT